MSDEYSNIPSHLIASSNHTILNGGNTSLLDDAADIATKFIPTAIASGVNEIYNIVPTVANYFGANMEHSDLRKRLVELDNDYARYYDDHKLGVDTAGFILGMFAPGMGGIKVLNAGQLMLRESAIGVNLGRGMGVLAPNRDLHLADAISQIRSTGNVFSLGEANTVKALAAGVGQAAYEGAAWETMVAVTMNQSPVLDQMSVSDLFWNGVHGAGVFGALGGVLTGVGTGWRVAAAGRVAEKELAPYGITAMPGPAQSPSDKILFKAEQLASMPGLPEGELATRAGVMKGKTEALLYREIKEEFGKLSGGDTAVATALFDHFKVTSLEGNVGNLLDAVSVGRANKVTAADSAYTQAMKRVIADPLGKHSAEDLAILNDTTVSWVKLHGDQMGTLFNDRPKVFNLADNLAPGEQITITPAGVKAGKATYSFSNNPHKPYNILGVDHRTTEARYFWAERLPKWEDGEEVMVHALDLPLLEKAVKDGISGVKVIPESGKIAEVTSYTREELATLLKQQKTDVAARIAKNSEGVLSAETKVDKLKSYFGINFNVVDDPAAAYTGWFMRKPTTFVDDLGNTHKIKADVITLEKQFLENNSLKRITGTLKHEEGHSMFQSILEAKGVTEANLNTVWPSLVDELAKLSKARRPELWKRKDAESQAYRNSAHELFADAFAWISMHPDQLAKNPAFNDFAGHLVRPVPPEILQAISTRATKATTEEIAKIVNVHPELLNGIERPMGWDARALARHDYATRVAEAGTRQSETVLDPLTLPSYAKMISKNSRTMMDGNEIQGLAGVAQRAKLYDDATRRISTDVLGEELPRIPDKAILTGNAGAGIASFSSGAMGSIQQIMEFVGQRTKNLKTKEVAEMHEFMAAPLQHLSNDLNGAIEFSVLNEKLRSLPQRYIWDADKQGLAYKFGSQEGSAARNAEVMELAQREIPEFIGVQNASTASVIEAHMERSVRYTQAKIKMRANEGYAHKADPDTFYPIPRNPKDTPYFAFVIDDSATATGHSSMIYAPTSKDLETLIQQIQSDSVVNAKGLTVVTKGEAEAYFKSQGTYEFERSLNDNYINTEMRRIGVSASLHMPLTDPVKIVDNLLQWHTDRSNTMIRDAVAHNYSRQFDAIVTQAETSLLAAKSKLGYVSSLAYAENAVNNPASNLIKLALDIQKREEYPIWTSVNKMLDHQVSKYWGKVSEAMDGATAPEHLDAVGEALKKTGYAGVLPDAELYRAMNAGTPSGALTKFVGRANALVSTFALRLDPLNAINNTIGSAVLLGSETQSILKAIRSANPEAAGELSQLMKIGVPGTKDLVDSPTKLIANSIARYHNNPELLAYYKKHGFISSITQQYNQVIDDIGRSLVSDTNVGTALSRMNKYAETGEKLTGNRMAEEFNRFVAADVMKQITDVAVKGGIMDERTALAYINTFVNRTQGNYVASQRPLMFQGPIGQAIGLFQTYQFNLIQQLLRHVGEGQAKTATIMMGLQGSIYGMNGLPAFNAINTHLIGNAPGNTQHTDLIQATYSGAGKVAGDWLMYGGLSNAMGLFHPDLKVNMYSRGDVNPRNITIVPTDPASVPIVQAATRMYQQIGEGLGKVGAGAPVWETFLRGLEQNGVSRPLAGLAQVLEGGTVGDGKVTALNPKGNITMSHDLLHLATLTRLAGGKPLDEALVNDAMFRINTYQAKDAKKRAELGEAIKISVLGGKGLSEEQTNDFAAKYARTGGKQENFAQFMAKQYQNVNTSQANQLRTNLSSSYATHLQRIMGGYELEDLSK
jgi:hypothetical protein